MELNNLTFILTADCNYNCSYCMQKKEKKTVTIDTIDRAVEFFYPFFHQEKKNHMAFYGGEPLLAFPQLQHAVLLVKEMNKSACKKIEFSITTNGSLLTRRVLDFFQRHGFRLVLSFDGLAQDMGRKKGSLEQIVTTIKRIQDYPGIEFEINSVFSPRTAAMLSHALRFMIEPGGPEITFNISTMQPWKWSDLEILEKELDSLMDFLVRYYKKTGTIPVKNFQDKPPGPGSVMFTCGAGRGRMAVTPEGDIWGCSLLYDYFKSRRGGSQYRDYYFGALADFKAGYRTVYPVISANYAQLRRDFFQVKAGQGEENPGVEGCGVCPVNAAYTSGSIGKISCRQCRLIKIQINAWKTLAHRLNFESLAV